MTNLKTFFQTANFLALFLFSSFIINAQAQVITDNYSNPALWTRLDDSANRYSISNNSLLLNTQYGDLLVNSCQQSSARIVRNLGSALTNQNAFRLDLQYRLVSMNNPGPCGFTLVALTNNNAQSYTNQNCQSGFICTNNTGVSLLLSRYSTGQIDLRLQIKGENATSTGNFCSNSQDINIPTAVNHTLGTDYFLSLTKNADNSYRIQIFSDVTRLNSIFDRTYCSTITVGDLKFVQHSNHGWAGGPNHLTARIGNLSIFTNPSINASITGQTSTCAGSPVTLTASGGGTYSWTASSGTNPANVASITVSPTVTTTYTATITSSNGCTSIRTHTVNVLSLPTPTNTTVSTCLGTPTTLTAIGGGTYLWSTGANTPSIGVNPLSTTTYNVTVTALNGCRSVSSSTVNVLSLSTASISGATSTCFGTPTILTAIGGGTYLWSTGATTATISANSTATTAYTVTITSVNGCKSIRNHTVTVLPLPIASISGLTSTCIGSPVALTATGGGTYLWSTGATTAAISANPTATTTYTVTVIAPNGCTSASSRSVAVLPLPVISLVSLNVKCEGSVSLVNIDINVTGGTAPYTYSWNSTPTAVLTQDFNGAVSSGSICVTVTDAKGCKTSRCFNCLNICSNSTGSPLQGTDNNPNKVIKEDANTSVKEFDVYPNPTIDELNIIVNIKETETAEIIITNMLGAVIDRKEANNARMSFDTSQLPKGMYLVSFIKDGELIQSNKVVKQ